MGSPLSFLVVQSFDPRYLLVDLSLETLAGPQVHLLPGLEVVLLSLAHVANQVEEFSRVHFLDFLVIDSLWASYVSRCLVTAL